MKRSPTLEGFRAIFRQPSLALAEITWRWSLGVAGFALCLITMVEYFDTLPVSVTDRLLLRTGQPALMGSALQHILGGNGLRFVEAAILLGLGFAVAWIVVASLGRAASLKALQECFAQSSSQPESERRWSLGPLAGLNSVRAAVTLATAVGCLGAVVLGSAVSSDRDPSPGTAFLIFLVIFVLVSLAWLVLNWFLSLASLFVVVEGQDWLGAMAAAADLCGERPGAVLAVSFWFGLAHLAAFVFASAVAFFLLSFLAVLPGKAVFGLVLLVTLLYFAVADCLYMGRLAAYVYIAENPEGSAVPDLAQPSLTADPPASSGSGRIDPDELILSDLPLPVGP